MTLVLQCWTYRAAAGCRDVVVFPDGCRDVLLVEAPGKPPRYRVIDLQAEPRSLVVQAGTRLTGLRMQPGVSLCTDKLLHALGEQEQDLAAVVDLVNEMGQMPRGLSDVMACLSQGITSPGQIASAVGVRPRTLQRQFRNHGLGSLESWGLLARARQVALRLATSSSVSAIAAEGGYADQAHMTREFRRWFGLTPSTLRRNPRLLGVLSQPGLGTGEHISIR